MNEYLFGKDKLSGGCVIALGGFDSVHLGHRYLINEGLKIAKSLNLPLFVFTLDGDLSIVNKAKIGQLFTYEERAEIFSEMGVNGVIRALFNEEFAKIPPQEFLKTLKNDFNAAGFICGGDYTFGTLASGTAKTLNEFCLKHDLAFKSTEFLSVGGEKISTRAIKRLLLDGKVCEANGLLGSRYFVAGEVVHGRAVASGLGFPTANMLLPRGKLALKRGVYATRAKIDGEQYLGVTNFASAPTFGVSDLVIETHFLNYGGDLYGKRLRLEFDSYIRDCVKFSSVGELTERLKNDVEFVKRQEKSTRNK